MAARFGDPQNEDRCGEDALRLRHRKWPQIASWPTMAYSSLTERCDHCASRSFHICLRQIPFSAWEGSLVSNASHMQSLHAGAPLEAIASKGRTALACAAAFHLNQDSQAWKYGGSIHYWDSKNNFASENKVVERCNSCHIVNFNFISNASFVFSP